MQMQKLKVFASYASKVVSSKEMRAIELNAHELGIAEKQLMENAGKAVADFVERKFPKEKRILVACGTGNNGGDGFVAALHLSKKHDVSILLLGKESSIKKGPALENFLEVKKSGIKPLSANEAKEALSISELIIDAIFGTGFHGNLPNNVAKITRLINASYKPIIAVDVPSGLREDGSTCKDAIKPSYTLTFHKLKLGCNASNCGKIIVKDIGIPYEAELFTGIGDAYLAYTKRDAFSHKGMNGKVLVIGGSTTYHGAPIMAINAANNVIASLRVGAGYAVACLPRKVAYAARVLTANIIVKEFSGDMLTLADSKMLKEEIKRTDALIIGPGLGREEETLKTIAELVDFSSQIGKKVIADADACYAAHMMKNLSKNVLFTPHDKEFEGMLGKAPEKESEEALIARAKAAIKGAKELNAMILLKGHNTIITDGKKLKINRSKSAALATMGTGDVLAGIIGGYAAAGAGLFEAASAGAYLHSKIADEFAEKFGEHMIAEDIINMLPKTLKEMEDMWSHV